MDAKALSFYQTHPVEFAQFMLFGFTPEEVRENRLGNRLEPESIKILSAVGEHDLVTIPAGRGVTKCSYINDTQLLADGSYVRYGDLIGKEFEVMTLADQGYLFATKAFATDNGEEECVKLTFRSGIETTRTLNHPFLTFNGWTPCEDLKSGSMVAMPSSMPINPDWAYQPEILKFLAYHIGDGCSCGKILIFSHSNEKVVSDYAEAVKDFGGVLARINKCDYRVNKSKKLRDLLQDEGLLNKKAKDKFIPDILFNLWGDNVILFLNRLFGTDSTIYCGKSTPVIAYTSVSKQLCTGVKRLLLRFGIVSSVKKQSTKWTHKGITKTGVAYKCEIHDCRNILKFCNIIGAFGKEDKIAKIKANAERQLKRIDQATTGFTIWPPETLDYLLKWRDDNGYKDKDFRPLGIRNRDKKYGKTVSERTVRKFAEKHRDTWIDKLLRADVVWDTIESIERVGKKPTVAISVPGTHNYINDHFEHNTFSLAILIIWFVWTRKNSKAMVTGPKFDQLKSTIWNEVRKWINHKGWLLDELEWTSEKLEHKDPKVGSFAKLLTAKDKENIAGIHDEHVLWIVDEASNVDENMIDTIMGGMNDPESKMVMAGNPTKASGAFFNSFTRDRDIWHVIQLSAENCKRQNKAWMKKMKRHPRESDMYRVNVLGLPPRGNPKAIIPLEDVRMAVDRTVKGSPPLEIGLDPASEGNDLTTIAARYGMHVFPIKKYAKTKAYETVQYTLDYVRYLRKKTGYEDLVKIKVDDSGYGQAIRQLLALNTTDNVEVVPCIFFGGKQKGDDVYANYGTIMWYNFRDIIDQVELPPDEDLIEELSTREWVQSGGKITIEPKSHFKERFRRSPDSADAIILCFAGGSKKVLVSEKTTGVQNFEVDWTGYEHSNADFVGCRLVDALHISALVIKDLEFCGLCAVYEFYEDKLWVYSEVYQDTPDPEEIAQLLKFKTRYGILRDGQNVKVYGGASMFKKDKKALFDTLRRERLIVIPPTGYEEYGAISLGTKMFKNEQIIVHERCKKAREQINLWSLKNGALETGGFAEALLIILSEVRNRRKLRAKNPKIKDYVPVYEKRQVETSHTEWMGR